MLFEGHDIRQHLARMRAPREAVDDRHRGLAREFRHAIGIERPDHDGIDIARQHACPIADGLAAAELHLLCRQHDGVAAELAHADLERNAGTRRRPLEDHRQGLAGERTIVGRTLRLHGAGVPDHPAQIAGWNVDEVEEVPDRAHRRASGDAPLPSAPAEAARPSGAQARSRRAIASATSCSVTISGGSRRTTLSPAATVIIFSARSASTSEPAGTTARSPISNPSPRTSAITAGWRSLISARRCLSRSAMRCTRSKNPGSSITSSTALATLIASGLKPKVEPCVPGVIPLAASAVARLAPTGKPPPSALASAMMSGVTPV